MRNRAIFAGLVAALASLTAPALANNSKPQPVAEPPASSSSAARCSRCRMERGSGSRARKWVRRSSPHANPRHEVRSIRRADRACAVSRPSALMRAADDLHGVFDPAPHAGFLVLALALALLGVARRFGDRLKTVLVDHLPRDGVNFRLGYHVALPKFHARNRGGSPATEPSPLRPPPYNIRLRLPFERHGPPKRIFSPGDRRPP